MDLQENPQIEDSTRNPNVTNNNDNPIDALSEDSLSQGTNKPDETDWEDRYKNSQSEYSKLQQKMKSIESAFGSQGTEAGVLNDEQKAAADYMKEIGFADMNSVQGVVKQSLDKMERETELREVLASNPGLAPYTKAIRKLAETDPGAPIEAIITDNGFLEREKLIAANNQGGAMGVSIPQEEVDSISTMSDEKYQDFLNGNSKNKFTRRLG